MSSLDAARVAELRLLRGVTIGDPLVAVFETGSTNDDAMDAARALASNAPSPAARKS